ncbi:MAG: glutamate--tRNA ligase [Caulobacteraceae bacterium]|nr:glutamate--tRNA ligase [Caulobacter sp.]
MTDPSATSPAPPRKVVTRIAPSPTGSMHIGTARTALFNLLYARHNGGEYLVRVEDTDRERSTAANVEVIFDGLRWLGLEPDRPPVFQAERAPRHVEAVGELLARGAAYRDYTSVADGERERELARAEGRVVRSAWRDRDPAEAPDGAPFTVRLRAPQEGETVVDDLVKGRVVFRNAELDDLVLLRSDGTPTYNLAVVVDDHDMGITHVIRGDDHLNNAARQTLIYQGLGWEVPAFAHLPLIHGPDGAKLSKRHGAQAVGEFREMGYLPEAMRNYLARLGWGHGDDELFTDEEAAAWFDVADVVKAPARLDWPKLGFINQHYIRDADDARLLELAAEAHRGRGVDLPDSALPKLAAAIPFVKEGAQTILQLADLTAFAIRPRPVGVDEKTAKLLTEETRARLSRLAQALAAHQGAWAPPELEAAIRAFAASEGVGLGKFGAPLRGVLGGGAPAPDLASTLSALGREEALGRLSDALSAAA